MGLSGWALVFSKLIHHMHAKRTTRSDEDDKDMHTSLIMGFSRVVFLVRFQFGFGFWSDHLTIIFWVAYNWDTCRSTRKYFNLVGRNKDTYTHIALLSPWLLKAFHVAIFNGICWPLGALMHTDGNCDRQRGLI